MIRDVVHATSCIILARGVDALAVCLPSFIALSRVRSAPGHGNYRVYHNSKLPTPMNEHYVRDSAQPLHSAMISISHESFALRRT